MNKRQTELSNTLLHGETGEGLTPSGLPVHSNLVAGEYYECCKVGSTCRTTYSNTGNPARLGETCRVVA